MDAMRTLQLSAVPVLLLGLGITGGPVLWKDRSAPPAGDSTRAPRTGGLRECPETWSKDFESHPAVGRITNVPEFHDCQRFVRDTLGRLVYDSLYAIFAVDDIAGAWGRLTADKDSSDTHGELFGIIYTFGGTADTLLADGDPSHGGNYQELGIASGFNCLYLYNPSHLSARMVQYGLKHGCPNSMAAADSQAPHQDLVVHQILPPPGLSADDIPRVARWDWDPKRKTQYIGIYCGGAWCEVGGDGSATYQYLPDRAPPEPPLPAERRRVAEIKGWYDEQRLAIGPPDHPVPSKIWGTIYPVSDLWSKKVKNFEGKWVPVAYATVTADYDGKLILRRTARQGPPDQQGAAKGIGANIIEFCKGPATTLTGRAAAGGCTFKLSDGPIPAACHGPDSADAPWWRKVVSPTGAVLLTRCLKRWDHTTMSATSITVPGTARWRWLASDEHSWGRCGGGCCQ